MEAFKNFVESIGLGHYYNELEPLLRHAIRLSPRILDEEQMVPGQTKIGGRPDLPDGVEWPMETNTKTVQSGIPFFTKAKQVKLERPLSFIAQINLAEIEPFDKDGLLPKTGMLYFFYTSEQNACGTELEDKNKFQIIYQNSMAGLKRREFPSDLTIQGRYKACAVDMLVEINLPCYHKLYEEFTEDELYRFNSSVSIDDNINKLLGYADDVQGGEIELDCDRIMNSLSNNTDYQSAQETGSNTTAWKLLLQIDSNNENGMEWIDMGRLYFLIKEEDLKEKKFDNAWFNLSFY